MTQIELEDELATITGESRKTIRHRGFNLVVPLRILDFEDGCNTEPQVVDWDDIDNRRRRHVAA